MTTNCIVKNSIRGWLTILSTMILAITLTVGCSTGENVRVDFNQLLDDYDQLCEKFDDGEKAPSQVACCILSDFVARVNSHTPCDRGNGYTLSGCELRENILSFNYILSEEQSEQTIQTLGAEYEQQLKDGLLELIVNTKYLTRLCALSGSRIEYHFTGSKSGESYLCPITNEDIKAYTIGRLNSVANY